jgi:photosynthetic reaction center cytochrome c subunit
MCQSQLTLDGLPGTIGFTMQRHSAFTMLATVIGACRILLVAGLGAALVGCERPPVQVESAGPGGSGTAQIRNPRLIEAEAALHVSPPMPAPAAVRPGGRTAGQVYKSVQILGDLSIGEFGRTMNAITEWISPQQGCAYCHVEGDFADDSKYTKTVARRMLQMTQRLNTDWRRHVGETGVTCYTCHRGQPVPLQLWFRPLPLPPPGAGLGDFVGRNLVSAQVGRASLPSDPFSAYLLAAEPIRVAPTHALPQGDVEGAPPAASLQATELTYGLMMHFSKSLGVNCTFCHHSRSFSSWDGSPPQRVVAWHGIRMVRELNADYLEPLTDVFPANRKGPTGDAPKLYCMTCHQGLNKPLNGAPLAAGFPALLPREAVEPPPEAAASAAGAEPARN